MIRQSDSFLHWNYFLSLESDLAYLARFVELTEQNFRTSSIEIAGLLQSACSEVDVLSRQLCEHFNPTAKADSIDQYRSVLRREIPEIESSIVLVPRYGLHLDTME